MNGTGCLSKAVIRVIVNPFLEAFSMSALLYSLIEALYRVSAELVGIEFCCCASLASRNDIHTHYAVTEDRGNT